ncbi:MAG: hypothetical protein ACOC5T_02195 [Elusimicrobiota bacterium]
MDYDEILDEAEDDYEQSQDLQDAQIEQYEGTYPTQKKEDSIYNWFWRVVRLNKPFKIVRVGNLTKQEIGEHGISVRDAVNLGNLGRIFNHPVFGSYWDTRAKIVSASSMAKNGWFMELSISQKKVRERKKKSSPESWRLFKKKKSVEED